jgi:PP-loop superfamily ATP-utilizing enzyme
MNTVRVGRILITNHDVKSNSGKNQSLCEAQRSLERLGLKGALLFEHSQVLRIQLSEVDFDRAVQNREILVKELKAVGYRFVALDLEQAR